MRSISDLSRCAPEHFTRYVDPIGTRSFHTYDRIGDPNRFEPGDALIPALLSAQVTYENVNAMFGGNADNPYTVLRVAIDRVLSETEPNPDQNDQFLYLDLDDPDNHWGLVRECLGASNSTSGIKAAKVTKMLHRKRPLLVPIFDSEVADFYGCSARAPWEFWRLLQSDIRANLDLVMETSRGHRTSDGREISPLRVADIVIWEHCVSGCAAH